MSDLKIRPLVTHNLLQAYGQNKQVAAPKGSGFGDLLSQSINKVQASQTAADMAVNQAVMGQGQDLHQVMVAQEEASITFELMMEVRNKLMEAYQQIMAMQV
ncbi:MAG: flagellar hook-basal body complex protein FliE [bacterium]|nr:flagellar hook-basal body complex protein FliE [bacterium]